MLPSMFMSDNGLQQDEQAAKGRGHLAEGQVYPPRYRNASLSYGDERFYECELICFVIDSKSTQLIVRESMEEIVVIILQVFFEVFFNAIISLPFEWLFSTRYSDNEQNVKGCLFPVLFIAVGAGCGWVSLLILPKLLIGIPALRLVNLIFAPLMAGGMAVYLASWRQKEGKLKHAPLHFLNAFLFTLAFVGVRWAYSK